MVAGQRDTTLQDKVIQMPNPEPEKYLKSLQGMGHRYQEVT